MEFQFIVLLKGKVYTGGGYAENEVEGKTINYNPQEDSQSTLSPYTYSNRSCEVMENDNEQYGVVRERSISYGTNEH